MDRFDGLLHEMDLRFFGTGKHKISMEKLIDKQGVFLDVRSNEEAAVMELPLTGLIDSMHIPIDEIPNRTNDIPKDRLVGTFCSGMVRAIIVYAYLYAQGYENVRIIEGGYPGMAESLKPGRIWKRLHASDSRDARP